MKYSNNKNNNYKSLSCPKCKSLEVIKRGYFFRGFHGSINSANVIMKGWEIYYNFITKHQTINCCPYELAIPELKDKLNVNNKWPELIKLSNQNQNI